MLINRGSLDLLSNECDVVIGRSNAALFSDHSLFAFLRAIAIKYGVASPEEIAKKASVRVAHNRSGKDGFDYVGGCHESLSIVMLPQGIEVFASDAPSKEWTELDKSLANVNMYLSQFAYTKVFVNTKIQRTVVFVSKSANHHWVQALEGCVCKIMPWLFPEGVTDEWKRFVKSIAVENKNITDQDKESNMINFCNNEAKKFDARNAFLHKKLDNISSIYIEKERESAQSSLENLCDQIDRYRASLTDLYAKLASAQERVKSLSLYNPDTSSVYYDFFAEHKNVRLLLVDEDRIIYGVDDYLEYFESDLLQTFLDNQNSWHSRRNKEQRELMKALFIDKTAKLAVKAMFSLSGLKLVNPIKSSSSYGHLYDDFSPESVPNHHIYSFACSGENAQYYESYAATGDWDLGIEQSIAATKNLNVGDTIVFNKLLDDLTVHNTSKKCIHTNDGRILSYDEFAAELNGGK